MEMMRFAVIGMVAAMWPVVVGGTLVFAAYGLHLAGLSDGFALLGGLLSGGAATGLWGRLLEAC